MFGKPKKKASPAGVVCVRHGRYNPLTCTKGCVEQMRHNLGARFVEPEAEPEVDSAGTESTNTGWW